MPGLNPAPAFQSLNPPAASIERAPDGEGNEQQQIIEAAK